MNIQETDFLGFVKGREKSFETIFYQYYKTLVSFAIRHGLEEAEAEDIVLETFHHLWEIREDLKSSGALHSLLFTAVRNRALNVHRNVINRHKIAEEHFSLIEEEESGDFLMEEEMTRLLDAAIANLPPQCQQVVLLSLSGKSLHEIADEMQLSINSVKTYKLRAIQTLRESLKKYPYLVLMLLTKLM